MKGRKIKQRIATEETGGYLPLSQLKASSVTSVKHLDADPCLSDEAVPAAPTAPMVALGGTEYVVIEKADYDAMRAIAEDGEDSAVAAAARLDDDATDDWPGDVVHRILDGEHPVRVLREWRGLTIAALAKQAGCAASYVSQLENDTRVGTIETMVAIAVSLEVEADELLGWIAQRVTAASSDN